MLGRDPARADRAWRERIGIVLQQCRMRPELTVRETLELYAGYYSRAARRRRDDRPGRARAQGGRPGGQPLGRPAAPSRRRRRPDRRSGAALPRRADDRLRPLRAPPGVGRDRRAARARQDGLPHHPLHGRGAAARRPGDDHRRRADRRRRAPGASSATASSRPATISFRLPAGVAAGELPAELAARPRGSTASLALDGRRPGAVLTPAHRLGARARRRRSRASRSRRPTLEDIYLELTAAASRRRSPE